MNNARYKYNLWALEFIKFICLFLLALHSYVGLADLQEHSKEYLATLHMNFIFLSQGQM